MSIADKISKLIAKADSTTHPEAQAAAENINLSDQMGGATVKKITGT